MARSSRDGCAACLLFHKQIVSYLIRRTEKLRASMAIRQGSGVWRIFSVANGLPVWSDSQRLTGEMIPLHITEEMAAIAQRWWERLANGDIHVGEDLTCEKACLLACHQAGLFVFCDPDSISADMLRVMAISRYEALEC